LNAQSTQLKHVFTGQPDNFSPKSIYKWKKSQQAKTARDYNMDKNKIANSDWA
jgi:hypothetical protein